MKLATTAEHLRYLLGAHGVEYLFLTTPARTLVVLPELLQAAGRTTAANGGGRHPPRARGIHGTLDRWGVSADEVTRRCPCDALVSSPALQAWRGVSVAVPPAALWPWVAQVRLAPGEPFTRVGGRRWGGSSSSRPAGS